MPIPFNCVWCKCQFFGEPYDAEDWVGFFCSEECKKRFDEERDQKKDPYGNPR